MTRGTNFKIARAHITSRLKQTLVAMLSVTFGISMYIFMNSFMTGVNDAQTKLAFSTLAHVHIYNDLPEDNTNLVNRYFSEDVAANIHNAKVIQYTEGIKNSESIIQALKDELEITGITSQLNINVFFRNGATQVNGLLSGVDVENEDKLFKTSDYMLEGEWSDLQYRSDGVIIGSGLAKKLSLRMNDNVVIMTVDGISRTYKIIGIFETSLASVDNAKAYIRINTARQLLSKNRGYVTDIQINIEDYNDAREWAEQWASDVSYTVEPWPVASGQLEAANQLRNIIAVAVSLTILLVAGFGIYNIMNMTVNEKIKEIAILKAMGFEGRDVVQIFITQSIIIGIAGGLLGMLLGYLVTVGVNQVPFHVANLETLPVTYRNKDYLLAFAFGLLTTFIAGYLPAKNASKVDPVEIIRG
ncbi:MAG: FtsX-like permease family protein [Cyclobacteriaceae bacterium]